MAALESRLVANAYGEAPVDEEVALTPFVRSDA